MTSDFLQHPLAESTHYEDGQKSLRSIADTLRESPKQTLNAMRSTTQRQPELAGKDETLQYSRLPSPEERLLCPQSTLVDFTQAEDTAWNIAMEPQTYSYLQSNRTNAPPTDLVYGSCERSVEPPPISPNVTGLGNRDRIRNSFRSLDTSAADDELLANYGILRQPGAWQTYRRSHVQPQNTPDNTTDSNNWTNQTFRECEFSSRQPFNFSRRQEDPQSLRDCAAAKRCGRVLFNSSDKCDVQNPQLVQMRRNQMENLVHDTYCPGIIQQTIDGIEDFNATSFNIFFGTNLEPPEDDSCRQTEPMTLLEAFALRIDKEQSELNQKIQEDATETIINETITKHFASAYPSDLNRSIKSLLLSERLAERNQIETSKTSSFKADVEKKVLSFELLNVPVKLVTYIGQTKPTE